MNKSPSNFHAVALGSTNVKSILFDTKGDEIAVSSYASQQPISLKPGWWEQDMNLMWESTVKSIKGIFDKGYTPEEISGIFVTGQGNGLMPIDSNGNPSRMGILSLDSRSSKIHGQWMADGRYVTAMQTVGMPFPTGSPLALLAWFIAEEPDGFDKMDKILFSKDWIRYKLSGVICTDQTDASGGGLMNLAKNEYATEVFSLLGLDAITDKLPPIRMSHEVVGAVTQEAALTTGLLEGTPVLCGAHDICAYPFGVGSVDSKQLVSVIGTWGFNIIPIKDATGAPAALYHTVPGYLLTGVGDGNSGGCFDIIINTLCHNEKFQAAQRQMSVYDYIEEMVRDTRPTGVLFHPFIFGSIFNSAASAGFYGMKNWHKKADLLRAVYEGIVMGHYAYIKIVPGNQDFESIWLIGGGSKSPIFGQMFADITGLRIKVPKVREITGRGGAMNAWVGLGVYKNHEQACIPPEIEVEYLPDPEMQAFYQKKFEVFNKISELNQNVWPALNEMSL